MNDKKYSGIINPSLKAGSKADSQLSGSDSASTKPPRDPIQKENISIRKAAASVAQGAKLFQNDPHIADSDSAHMDDEREGLDSEIPGQGASDEVAADEIDPTDLLKLRIETLSKTVEEEKGRALLHLANLENTRRRLEKEKQDALRFGASNFIRDILVVADNLTMALSTANDSLPITRETWKGVEITERELYAVFKRHNITTIQPVAGDAFDYDIHLAIGQVNNHDVPDGTVSHAVQPGFKLHDRLLRPASVMVAKHEVKTADTSSSGPDNTTETDAAHQSVDKEV